MNIVFDYFSITLLVGGVTAILSGSIVFLHKRHVLENQAWLALNICSAVWSFGYFSMINAYTKDIAFLSNVTLHAAAILIPLFYTLSILAITKTFDKHKIKFFIASAFAFFLLAINPSVGFVADLVPNSIFRYTQVAGPLYNYFTIYFFTLVTYSLFIVFKKLRQTGFDETVERARLKSILLFTIAGFGGGGSVFLLTYGFIFPPYPLILFAIYPAISGYAIFKYQLFDVKVIATQILTFTLWVFILIRTLLADTPKEQFINGILLLVTLIFGNLLIRSVLQEVKTREKIEKLANDLEAANERLKELDQLKSEFVSLATHQIRGPLTSIKGYASLMIEGDYGEIPQKLQEPIDTIFQSSKSLAVIVDDFLNVSRIEQGKMKYDFTTFDLCALANEVVMEAQPAIEKRALTISATVCPEPTNVSGDRGKIKQVIGNILDNSIKYTPKGSIALSLTSDKAARKILLTIKDTGVGIRPETIPHLFQKFSRAEDASKVNILGTGLGLYVAKEMIKAHGGRIWVESPGEGKGSTFFVELAMV
ncbi:MAG: ATP-binding protein [Patescibacteria group bacterium]